MLYLTPSECSNLIGTFACEALLGTKKYISNNISGTWVYEDYLNYGEKEIRLEPDKGCSSPLFIDKKYFASYRHICPYMLYLILGNPDNADWLRLEKVVE